MMDFDHSALLHDEMEQFNLPVYFHQFVERAAQHGLQYLVEADFPMVMPNGLPREVVDHLFKIAGNVLEMEQYMDFLRNRTFRRTLLCHADLIVDRRLVPERVRNFYVTSSATLVQPEPGTATPGVEQFRGSDGALFSTDHAITKAAFRYLIEIAPGATRFDKLFIEACKHLGITQPGNQDAAILAANLLQAFSYSLELIEFHVHAPEVTGEVTERPLASRLARVQARSSGRVTSVWHRRVEIDGLSRLLLPNLDGQNDRSSLFHFLFDLAREGKISVNDGDKPAETPERAQELLVHELDITLRWLAKAGLLVG
jgi:methyltransferase-like protein